MLAFRTKVGLSPRDLKQLDPIDRELIQGVEAQLPLDLLVRSVACSSEEALGRLSRLIGAGLLEEERFPAGGNATATAGGPARERGQTRAPSAVREPLLPANDVKPPFGETGTSQRRALSITEVDGRPARPENDTGPQPSRAANKVQGTRPRAAKPVTHSNPPLDLPRADAEPVQRVSRITEVDARTAADLRTSLPPAKAPPRTPSTPRKQAGPPPRARRNSPPRAPASPHANGANHVASRSSQTGQGNSRTGATGSPQARVHGAQSRAATSKSPRPAPAQQRPSKRPAPSQEAKDAAARARATTPSNTTRNVVPSSQSQAERAEHQAEKRPSPAPVPSVQPEVKIVERSPEPVPAAAKRGPHGSVHERVTVIDEARAAAARAIATPSAPPIAVVHFAAPPETKTTPSPEQPSRASPSPPAKPNPFGEETTSSSSASSAARGTGTTQAIGPSTPTSRGTGTVQALPPSKREDKPNGTLVGIGTLVYDRAAKASKATDGETAGRGTGTIMGIGTGTLPRQSSTSEASVLSELAREWERGNEQQRGAAVQVREAIRREAEGQYGQAVSILQLVLLKAKDPRISEERERIKKRGERAAAEAVELRERAREASKAKNYRIAADLWSKVATLIPKDREALACAAAALLHTEGPHLALPFAERAVEIDPRGIGAHKLLLRVYERMGDPQKAARERALISELTPKSGMPDFSEFGDD